MAATITTAPRKIRPRRSSEGHTGGKSRKKNSRMFDNRLHGPGGRRAGRAKLFIHSKSIKPRLPEPGTRDGNLPPIRCAERGATRGGGGKGGITASLQGSPARKESEK